MQFEIKYAQIGFSKTSKYCSMSAIYLKNPQVYAFLPKIALEIMLYIDYSLINTWQNYVGLRKIICKIIHVQNNLLTQLSNIIATNKHLSEQQKSNNVF